MAEFKKRRVKAVTFNLYEDQAEYYARKENKSEVLRWVIDNQDEGFKKYQEVNENA